MRIHSKFTQLGKCRLTYNLSLSMELRPSNIHALNLRGFFFEHYKTLTSSPIFLILRFSCKWLKLKMFCLNKAPLVFQALLILIILFTFLSNRKVFWLYMITLHGPWLLAKYFQIANSSLQSACKYKHNCYKHKEKPLKFN